MDTGFLTDVSARMHEMNDFFWLVIAIETPTLVLGVGSVAASN